MATGTSIVGNWTVFVDWGCSSQPADSGSATFKSDGTWSYAYGGGRWIQVEGMVIWTFTSAAGLSYSGNVTRSAVVGIMGYTLPPPNPGSGCFYMVRSTAAAAKGAKKEPSKAAAGRAPDMLADPQKQEIGRGSSRE